MKRLAVFLDGTYNDPGDNTNVWRLRSMLADQDNHGSSQLAYYDAGVGTHWYDKFRGGAVGSGIKKNIRDAYQWLVEKYDDGDEIYVFGFSRGAFSARSLTGMLAKCGLLIPGSPMTVLQVYNRYEQDDTKALYRLKGAFAQPDKFNAEDRWIAQYSRQVRVKFIGVWDTVGALNLKLKRNRHEKRGEYNSHFVRLSKFFDHAYQALAIDEHRKGYPISRWYNYIPEKAPDKKHVPPPIVEQRWFVGAHSNVGGGYGNDSLPQIPLEWIQSKAELADLKFRHKVQLSGDEYMGPVTDSYKQFLKGIYRLIKFGKRSYREIGTVRAEVTGGWIDLHYETIDGSVVEKWKADSSYRPENLVRWAQKNNLDPAQLSGTQNAHLS
jgi:uncharacterized protein (DUF2235 family)